VQKANFTAMMKEDLLNKKDQINIIRWYQAYALLPAKYYTGHTSPADQG
jgi:hypothetical protein